MEADGSQELLRELDHPLVGRTVYAAVPLRAGQLLISERPLITVGGLYAVDDRALRRLYRAGAAQLRCGMTSFLNIHAFVHASTAIQQRLLDHFCSYEVHLPLGKLPWHEPEHRATLPKLVQLAMRVSEWCCENVPCCEALAADTLTRAQCCFALNSHSLAGWLPDDPTLLAEHALFEQGSRLTHSCGSSANTTYHCVDGMGEHRTTRDIDAGEIITTSYLADRGGIGSGMAGTSDRRHYLLEGYLFTCQCARCTTPDLNRRFSCCTAQPLMDPQKAAHARRGLRQPESGLLPLPPIAVKLRFCGVDEDATGSGSTEAALRWAQGVCDRAATMWPTDTVSYTPIVAVPKAGHMSASLAVRRAAVDPVQLQVEPQPEPEPEPEHVQWQCDGCSRVCENSEIDISIHVPSEMLWHDTPTPDFVESDAGDSSGGGGGGMSSSTQSLFAWERALVALVSSPPVGSSRTTAGATDPAGSSDDVHENAVAEIFGRASELVGRLELCLRVIGSDHWVTATVREQLLDTLLEVFDDDEVEEAEEEKQQLEGPHLRSADRMPAGEHVVREQYNSSGERAMRNVLCESVLLSLIAAVRVQFVELWSWFEAHGVRTAWTGTVAALLRAIGHCPELLLAKELGQADECTEDASTTWLGLGLAEVIRLTIERTALEYGSASQEPTALERLAAAAGLQYGEGARSHWTGRGTPLSCAPQGTYLAS
eukprot:COSAG06_NODE_7443_length_2502_cov_1.574282_1_plen_711_part_00